MSAKRFFYAYGGLALVLASATGCGDREYTWTRKEPAMGRRSPTVFTARIRLLRDSNSVVWVEDVHDADGEIGRNVETLTDCTILDANNWDCLPMVLDDGTIANKTEMRDGKLYKQYWDERRVYRTRYRVLGIRF